MSERFPDFRAAEFDFNHSSRSTKNDFFPRSFVSIAVNDTASGPR